MTDRTVRILLALLKSLSADLEAVRYHCDTALGSIDRAARNLELELRQGRPDARAVDPAADFELPGDPQDLDGA